MSFRGATFDADGVLVNSPHKRAWCEAFRKLTEAEWSDVRPTPPNASPRQVTRRSRPASSARAALSMARIHDGASANAASADLIVRDPRLSGVTGGARFF